MRFSRLLTTGLGVIILCTVLFGPGQPSSAQGFEITACPNQNLVNGVDVIRLPGNCTLPAMLTVINNPTRHQLTIRGNGHTLFAAGGNRHFLINSRAWLVLDNVTLAGGNSAANGGSIYVQPNGHVEIRNFSVLRNNRTTGRPLGGGFGGAIFNDGGYVLVQNSTLRDNSAAWAGGAILNQNNGANRGVTAIKSFSTLSGNTAQLGGAIYNGALAIGADGETDILVSDSLLINNRATNGAGGAILNGSEVTSSRMAIFNSTFSGNRAASRGGAIAVGSSAGPQGPVEIVNNTFSGNINAFARAIVNTNGNVTLRNNIMASAPACTGSPFVAASDNLAVDGSCGTTGVTRVSTAALRLGPLQYNGGPLQTFALLPGSSAIDGVTGSCTNYNNAALTNDMRGRPRPAGTRCDIGAFEFNPHQLTVNVTGSGSVDNSAAGITCGADCTEALDGTVSLTASPAVEHTVAWGGCNTASGNTCTVDMSANNRTVTALFTGNPYTLAVSLDGTGTGTITSDVAGIDCGTTCASDFSYGTLVTLTAVPDAGNVFAGWSGPDAVAAGCGTASTCAVTVDQARMVTVTFNRPAPQEVAMPPGPPTSCDGVSVGGWGVFVECTPEQTAFTVPAPPPGYAYLMQPAYTGYGDVFTVGDHSPLPVMLCWQTPASNVYVGLYHDLPDLSREWAILPVTREGDSVCTSLPAFGGVALLRAEASGAGNALPAAAPVAGGPVSCQVTTTHIINFRAAPEGEILTRVPYQTTLTASARQGGWYQVEWLGQAGWISADYVTATCD